MKQRTRLMHSGDDLITQVMHKKTDGEIPLHKMKPQEHFIEAQVQEGDTLQAIALRFYCSVSELKRINHMHKDNEIFARRTIKVPVTPYSVLTECIPTTESEPISSTSSQNPIGINSSMKMLMNNTHEEENNVHINNKETADDYSIDCNAVILNSTVAPAVSPYTDTDLYEPLSEDTQLLPSKPKEPVESIIVKQLTSQGADFGIKWYHLLCLILILGFVIPLTYVRFYLDKMHENRTLEHVEHTTLETLLDDLPPLVNPANT